MTAHVTLLVEHAAELVTLAGPPGPFRGACQGELGIVRDGAVAMGPRGTIIAAGPTAAVREAVSLSPDAAIVDAAGRAVLPCFVDAHTHAIFAGDRAPEFAARLAGDDYLAILERGGGILDTVRATRAATVEQLLAISRRYLREMLCNGTTAVEIKSGYGLTLADELKLLDVAAALAAAGPLTVVPTFLGAHAIPPEYRDRPDDYVSLVVEEMIPLVASRGLARYCDVFCERGAFGVDQARRILRAGLARGLAPKVHADQKSSGAAFLAAALRAVSADHLEHVTDAEISALALAGTIAVLLPGATLILGEHSPPARRLIDAGVPIALATDFNPGTSPILSMPLIIGLACLRCALTPAEALVAATRNAAYAIGLGDRLGSLEPGKRADLLILEAPSHVHIPYWLGRNLVITVIKNGKVVWPG